MIELHSQPGELRMTIEVIRKATGLIEIFEMTSQLTQEQEDILLATKEG